MIIPIFNIPKISRKLSTSSTVQLARMRALVKIIQSRVGSTPKLQEDSSMYSHLGPGSIWKLSVASPGAGSGGDWVLYDDSPYPMIGFEYFTELGDSKYFIPLHKKTIFSVLDKFSTSGLTADSFAAFIEKYHTDLSEYFAPNIGNYGRHGNDFILDNIGVADVYDSDDNELDSDYSMYFEFVQDVVP